MQNLKNKVAQIVKDALAKYHEYDERFEKLKESRSDYSDKRYAELVEQLNMERGSVLKEAQKAVDNLVDKYNEQFTDTIDGSQLTPDATLLTAGFYLTGDDLNDMFDRSAGNQTMQQLIQRYADNNRTPGYSRIYVTAEQRKEDARVFSRYASSAFSRPEWGDIWTSQSYIDQMAPASSSSDGASAE